MKKLFEKGELLYLFLCLILIVILVFIFNNNTIYKFVSNINPIFQFLLITMGLYFIFFFVFKAIALRSIAALKISLGAVLLFMAADLLMPDYHATKEGLMAGAIFGKASVDYVIGYVISFTGITHGILLPLLTYAVSFSILFFLAILLIKNTIKKLNTT